MKDTVFTTPFAIDYGPRVELQSVEAVWARIDRAARAEPGGIVATDGDGTLWSGDLGEDMFRAFLDRGRVEPPALEALLRNAREHELSDAGSGSDVARRIYDAYLAGRFPEERMCELMAWCFAGWTRSEVRDFARGVVAESRLALRLHPEVDRLLRRVRAAGIDALLVSASPFAVIAEAGALAGFDDHQVVAAQPRYRGERMMAETERPIPYGKAKLVRLRERVGAAPLIAALGDNAFDVEMLAGARVPVAVRPKERLRRREAEIAGLVELTG